MVFLIALVPAFYGYRNAKVYYELSEALPKDMENIVATTKLQETFDMASTHMILADAKLSAKDAKAMMDEIETVDGVKYAIGFNSLVGSAVPEEVLPESLTSLLKSDKYQLMLVSSRYKVASDEVNRQVDDINAVLKKYDKNGMLIGEAPCTKDLITVTDRDFKWSTSFPSRRFSSSSPWC